MVLKLWDIKYQNSTIQLMLWGRGIVAVPLHGLMKGKRAKQLVTECKSNVSYKACPFVIEFKVGLRVPLSQFLDI